MRRVLLFAIAVLTSCANDEAEPRTESAIEHGRVLFDDPKTSSSPANVFACSTCHVVDRPDSSRIRPGRPLAGATTRTSFWGGQRLDLLEVGSSRVDLQACKLEYSIVSPK